ncbi:MULTISPECIES: peptidoglycan-binding protein [unclassified Frigoribacterium]|uniref:peptidoglycan-binding protein n=1 Tax=unclassified Frigoribacterium TaxID=2627005 RepID=UPI001AEB89B0|nr:peptidoglycan-binding protein [Frigoribacterium sp. PvP121]
MAGAVAGALLLSGCGLTGTADGAEGDAAGSSASRAADLPTAPVVRGDLVDSRTIAGTLGHGSPTPLVAPGEGTITELPSYGEVIGLDGVLWAVDESPVRSMHGTVPLWRTLEQGTEGADVAQLNDALLALGYDVADDDVFGRRTARAVRAWQEDRDREVTGTLGAADVAFVPGDVRVAEVVGRVGDPAGEVVWSWTSTTLVVTAEVSPVDEGRFGVGAPVEVGLPGGERVPGTVRSVEGPGGGAGSGGGAGGGSGAGGSGAGSGTGSGTGSGADRATVVVGLDAELPEGTATAGSVDLVVEGERRVDVLSVPVTALLAAGDGGYVVEVRAADGSVERVAVTVGSFAQGRVEVSGEGLAEGDEVVVPS